MLATLSILVAAAGSSPPFYFQDVSTERGILDYEMAEGMGGGVAAADYDGDGDIDVFVPTTAGAPDQLYRNDGRQFEEIAGIVGLAATTGSRVALWLDYDGDGDLDLLVANDNEDADSTYHLYRQLTPDQFEDVTAEAGLLVPMPPPFQATIQHRGGLCAGDLNNDGWLDIFAGLWNGAPHLFMNNGNGTFTDTTRASGISGYFHYAHQPMIFDINGDGWQDVYIAVDFLWNAMWINQRDGTFVDIADAAGADNAMNDMGMTLGDHDNDGDLDVYITNIFSPGARNILLRNDTARQPRFVEISESLRTDNGWWGWGCTFLDADNDGWIDIAATNGWVTPMFEHDPSRFFWNRLGSGVSSSLVTPFQDASNLVRFNDTDWGSCVIAFDADRDGDLDLMQTCNPGPLRLLENRPRDAKRSNNWLIVKPRMAGPNSHAIGTVVRVETHGLSQMRLLTAGTSYLGQEPAEACFGLGAADTAHRVTVRWPDGTETVLDNVPADRVLEVLHKPVRR